MNAIFNRFFANPIDFPGVTFNTHERKYFSLLVYKSPTEEEEKVVMTNYRIVEMVKIYGTQTGGDTQIREHMIGPTHFFIPDNIPHKS